MNRRCSGLDAGLDQFEGIERSAETRFDIGDYGGQPMDIASVMQILKLIGPDQRIVYFSDHRRNAIGRVKTLVRIGLSGGVCVGRDLPAAEIDGFQSCQYLLYGLVAGQCTQCLDIRFRVHQMPEPLST